MLYASMNSRTHLITVPGPAGLIQLSVDLPDELKQDPHFAVRGLALIAHPHPLLGGTMDNKVVQTLARTFNQLGYVSVGLTSEGWAYQQAPMMRAGES